MHERAEMRYNAACALALAGRADDCCAVLRTMGAAGELRTHELAADEDFAHVRGCEWMDQLLARGARRTP